MKGRFVLLALLWMHSILSAQQAYVLPQVTPRSPNAASMERYGMIPASLSSGIPNIEIPLTTINVDGLSIPIKLTYYNNGLKVEDIASMMGLGWDLNFGGMITYNQRGINDFDQSAGGMQYTWPNLRTYFDGHLDGNQTYNLFEDILNERMDSEFDSYQLNFLGHSEMVYFDTVGKAILTPKSNLKVIKLAQGLKVIDEAGNQFFFEQAEGSSSYESTTIFLSRSFQDVSAWHLSKILTTSGRQIRFTYKPYHIQYTKTNLLLSFYTSNCSSASYDYGSLINDRTSLLPDSIIYDQGYVKFLTSSSPRQDILNHISGDSVPSLTGLYVADHTGRIVTEYGFTQGYFNNGYSRLKLQSVEEKSGSEISQQWKFKYYGESSEFPSIFSKAKDHWGYYNGKTSNNTLIPEASYRTLVSTSWFNFFNGNYADRTSDFNYSKIGMLENIQYPTGGVTNLEYEPNNIRVNGYSNIVSNPFIKWSSGLPTFTQAVASGNTMNANNSVSGSFTLADTTICYMTAFAELDPTQLASSQVSISGPTSASSLILSGIINQIMTTTYSQGFGTIVLEPGTYNYACNRGYDYDHGRNLECNFEITTQVLDTSGTLPPFQGPGGRIKSIISYDSVAGVRSSAKRYIYHDSLNALIFRNIPWYILQTNWGAAVGFSGCNSCGTQFKIADESVKPFAGSTVEYLHVTELEDTSGTGGKKEYFFLPSTNEVGNNSKPYIAQINTSWKSGKVLTEKVYRYDTGNYHLIQETDNSYQTGTREHYTNGIKVDYSDYCPIGSPSNRSHAIGLSTLFTEQFFQNQSLTKKFFNDTMTVVTNTTANSTHHTLPTLTQTTNSVGQPLKEKIIYSFDYDTSVASTPASIAIRELIRRNILVPIEEIKIKTINDTDYVVGSTLYSYKADKPVIDQELSLKIQAPVKYSTFTPSSINGSGTFVSDGRYETRLLFSKYDAYNNVIEQQRAGDLITTYIWDYKNDFPIAEIINADSAAVAYTSFEADGTGNWSIGSSSRDASQGITGHSSYQLSNGNVTKSGLSTSTTYAVSYWTKNTTPFTISGTQGSAIKLRETNGWSCFRHKITGVSTINLSGSGIIDELRMYPWAAQMTTYTYDPLLGITSQCDIRNNISYYEYDSFGRLKWVRDQDKNIIRSYEYKFKEQQ